MMVKLKQWLIFFFFSWLRGGEEYFKEAWLATKTWIIKRVLSQAIVPHVKFTWNFYVILVWRALARISREIFHMNFMWKGFPVKTVWKSCELSHEFYVKLLHVNSLHTNPRDFRMKPHVKIIWNSFHVRHNWLCCALKNIKLCRMVNLKRYPYYLDVHPVFKYNNVRISW